MSSSTSGYLAEMGAWQVRHRPLSTTHDRTGTRSMADRRRPQLGQRLPGWTTDSPRGRRYTTTLAKLPTMAPSAAANATVRAVTAAALRVVPGGLWGSRTAMKAALTLLGSHHPGVILRPL